MTDRQEVWLRAWCATAGDENCMGAKVATSWADAALSAFDSRFVAPGSLCPECGAAHQRPSACRLDSSANLTPML